MIDLHLHLDGSLSISDARYLAALCGTALPEDEGDVCRLMTVSEDCGSLSEYLEKFTLPLSLLATQEALEYATLSLIGRLAQEGVVYAEIRFAPALHTSRGLTQREAVSAALAGLRLGVASHPISANLILCCMRGQGNEEDNIETLRVAKEFLGCGVASIDLAGDELKYPTESFEYLFSAARAAGIPMTLHAGEAAGAESVIAAVEAGAVRIGHGVRSVSSPEAVGLLVSRGVTLELCPSSNLQTGAVSSFDEYPLKRLMELGVLVTVNTDNKTVSHTSVREEYIIARDRFGLSEEELVRLGRNSARAAFVSEGERERLEHLIERRLIP